MHMALSLAERGTGNVSPNPRVGCVLVRDERIVGWGYHAKYGGPHAEIEALKMAGEQAAGSTAYLNLEPCTHYGKTPPCAPEVVKARIVKVVIAMEDPNPLVSGMGFRYLEEAGIAVERGVLEEEAKWLNRGFLRVMRQKRPWITIKAAMSLDGSIALLNGESQWISCPLSRKKSHLLRAEHDAILVGIETVLRDDPELTVRYVSGRSPLRVILDSELRTPVDAKAIGDGNCLVIAAEGANPEKASPLKERGVEVVFLPGDSEGIVLESVMSLLVSKGVNMLLVEGGSRVIASFIKAGLADEFSLFVAPKFLGYGIPLAGGLTFRHMEESILLKRPRVKQVEGDIWIEGVASCSPDL